MTADLALGAITPRCLSKIAHSNRQSCCCRLGIELGMTALRIADLRACALLRLLPGVKRKTSARAEHFRS